MSKKMLVNVESDEESRIAILSEGLLEEFSIETSGQEQLEGNIYKARIVKVIPSLDAVFVEYGGKRNGFLAVSDVHAQYLAEGDRKIMGVKAGQDLMVQVRKGEIGQKGAALTTYVSLPGRYFVLIPFVSKRGVSRKIEDETTRKQLRQVLDDAGIPAEMGYIVRTAAEGRTKQELARDAGYLVRLWKRIRSEYESAKAPALLYQDSDIVIRTIRDYFTPSIHEVWVDDEKIFEQVQSFFRAVMPWHQRRVRLYQDKAPLFSKNNLEAQIASIYEKTVRLPSGGSIVIEQTEALVSIDVNSGKTTKGKDIEETALIANREAAEETARQLRLRDLGGLVVIDFIDMRSAKHANEVRRVLQKALKEDKARTDTGLISKFGMLELSRQRLKPGVTTAVSVPCPVCSGVGKLRSTESFALSLLRLVQSKLDRSNDVTQTLVGVPPEVAELLLNRKRRQIVELETNFDAELVIFAETALQPNQYYIEYRANGNRQVDTNLPDGFAATRLKTPQGLPDAVARAARPPAYAHIEDVDGPEELDETSAETQLQSEDKPEKKKRRRRRKKRRDDEAPESADETAPPERETAAPPSSTEAESEKESEPVAAPNGGTDGPESGPKLSASAKRRLRRRRKKTQEDGNGPAEEEAPGEEAEAPMTAAAEEDGAPKTVALGEATEGSAFPPSAPASEDEPVSEETAISEPPSEVKTPAARRSRARPSRKRSTRTAAQPTQPTGEGESPSESSAGAEPEATPAPVDAGSEATELLPASASASEKPEKKPRRTRKRAPAAAKKPAAATTAPEANSAETTQASPRTGPGGEATNAEPDVSSPEALEPAEAPQPQPKPRRKRTPRKRATDVPKEASDGESA